MRGQSELRLADFSMTYQICEWYNFLPIFMSYNYKIKPVLIIILLQARSIPDLSDELKKLQASQ